MSEQKVRFAVIGLGNIAQMAVLPAFAHAKERCELVALVSSDETKKSELRKTYGVEHVGSYDELEQVLKESRADAAYITLPNVHHRPITERCARVGVHVLCEKPMATRSRDCEAMIRICDENDVQLMIAYRLHFEAGNLQAVELAKSGALGDLRWFSSSFGQQVRADDIRTKGELGGGALFDMGIYCVNAARYLFRAEPEAVFAYQERGDDPRFADVDGTTTAILRFPDQRFAQFTASQGSADVDEYRLVGTKGDLLVQPAFTYFGEITHRLTVDGETKMQSFPKSDQFAPELLHFAACIQNGELPEPSGEEGLLDVRILEAIAQSAKSGRPVDLPPRTRARRPDRSLEMTKPPVSKPRVVHAPSPSK